MSLNLIMCGALFLVALTYASVGLGGGTAFLSVLSFWTSDPATLRPLAWGLNIVVALVGIWNFRRKGHIVLREIWHYLAGGVAGGAIGAALPISDVLFRWLLAVTLAGLALRMLFTSRREKMNQAPANRSLPWPLGLLLGLVVGMLSGLVGIGGGIVLGPILLALGLHRMKRTAGLTVTFILIVSTGALATHFARGGTLPWGSFGLLCVLVLGGGFLGSAYGAGRAHPATLQRLLACIVLAAAANLVVKALS